jgi:hypothetical protein
METSYRENRKGKNAHLKRVSFIVGLFLGKNISIVLSGISIRRNVTADPGGRTV